MINKTEESDRWRSKYQILVLRSWLETMAVNVWPEEFVTILCPIPHLSQVQGTAYLKVWFHKTVRARIAVSHWSRMFSILSFSMATFLGNIPYLLINFAFLFLIFLYIISCVCVCLDREMIYIYMSTYIYIIIYVIRLDTYIFVFEWVGFPRPVTYKSVKEPRQLSSTLAYFYNKKLSIITKIFWFLQI